MTADQEARRKRALYRSRHRGTREMDEILGAFALRHLASLDDRALSEFERLLECPDPALYDWIAGATPAPPEHDGPILRALARFALEGAR